MMIINLEEIKISLIMEDIKTIIIIDITIIEETKETMIVD
jgi:hypothetical protein